MHVSKSAGTALCRAAKEARPKSAPRRDDCLVEDLHLQLNWFRRSSLTRAMGLLDYIPWGALQPSFQDVSCQDIECGLERTKWSVVTSERNIPSLDTSSTNGHSLFPRLVNSIACRDPIDRIESHYEHLISSCWSYHHNKNKTDPNGNHDPEQCFSLYKSDQDRTKFDVPELLQSLDILSDNYYLRSLSSQDVYKYEGRLSEHPRAISDLLPQAMHHCIPLIGFGW